jgi:hypothetical protein
VVSVFDARIVVEQDSADSPETAGRILYTPQR